MTSSNTNRLTTRFAIFFIAAAASLSGAVALVACSDSEVSVNGLAVEPETINKGESAVVSGTVSSLAELKSVSVTLLDDTDAPLPADSGLTIQSNGLTSDKISWDLRSDGDVKVVTTAAAKSGKYQIRVEGRTEEKNGIDKVSFTVR